MIKRERYLSKIRPFIGKPVIKVITGIRRCGKSVLLSLIVKELNESGIGDNNVLNINFETAEGIRLSKRELLMEHIRDFLEGRKAKCFLFLDEVQLVPGWERVVNSLQVEYDVDIYITGSNATLLSGDLSTLLAGRYVSFQIHPFSFSEFLQIHRDKMPVKELFQQYILFGGMPFLKYMNLDYEASMQYLTDVYSSVVIKDIVTYNKIREVDLLNRIVKYTLDNIGRTFSANSISRFFKSEGRKVAVDTILNYLIACENAFLIRKVKREDLRGKKLLKVNEKYYVEDHGFREAVLANNNVEIQLILENIVYMEMISRGFKVTVGKFEEREIDFVCTRNKEKYYLQVAYLMSNEETIKREFSVYKEIPDNYPKYVLSLDDFDFSREGIVHMNIIDFLRKG